MNHKYDTDFYKWTNDQADLLKQRQFERLDMENLIEEIESLGRSEKRTLKNYLENFLMHMMKAKYQAEKYTRSWDSSISEAEFKTKEVLSENPSLKPKLNEIFKSAYECARYRASRETGLKIEVFPEECPWELKKLFPDLEEKYL